MQQYKSSLYQMRFPQKLWYLLCIQSDAILWGSSGRTILVNYKVLDKYLRCKDSIFKTTHISSFIRQLNLYGFRKVTSHLQDPICNSSNPYMHEYAHHFFQCRRPELLNSITRKSLNGKKLLKVKAPSNEAKRNEHLSLLERARKALKLALKKTTVRLHLDLNDESMVNWDFIDVEAESSEEADYSSCGWTFTNNPINSMKALMKPDATGSEIDNTKITEVAEDNLQNTVKSVQDNLQTSTAHFASMPLLEIENVAHTSATKNEIKSEDGKSANTDLSKSLLNATKANSKSFANQFLNMPDLEDDWNDNAEKVLDISQYNGDKNDMNFYYERKFENQCNDDKCEPKKHVGDWDEIMFEEIMQKDKTQQSTSDLSELYSQISKTIDLLNS